MSTTFDTWHIDMIIVDNGVTYIYQHIISITDEGFRTSTTFSHLLIVNKSSSSSSSITTSSPCGCRGTHVPLHITSLSLSLSLSLSPVEGLIVPP